ncbi:hypothetical protein COCMIDRAFT_81963 [Bipolaris oryzae ATCC 44560]|uniref:Uncharacterized protein n=1 Tax=Bipolaris oryzae ATCC 44560 TaxID=930090 RepID=W6ZKB6_COCMI|nr:uncharacterized protein COCMIDRAFT_81963 [Bipolaris oryzae ATCC 44560]EUC50438.1 hypothetical protein COCMIDRAFT_81963 [Bipolaris oryzae ATCC 44560]
MYYITCQVLVVLTRGNIVPSLRSLNESADKTTHRAHVKMPFAASNTPPLSQGTRCHHISGQNKHVRAIMSSCQLMN